MNRSLAMVFIVALMVVPLAVVGCKSKVDKEYEMVDVETTEAFVPMEDIIVTQSLVTEPAQTQIVVQETIPPTAAVPSVIESSKVASQSKLSRNKEIQIILKAANFYDGNVDGKMGPKTRKAIIQFQRAKGLKPDGKVGPKTWAELEKYSTAQW